MVASTVQRTGEAARAVEDLEETLAIFDLKLRHMREVQSAPPPAPDMQPEEALQHLLSVSMRPYQCNNLADVLGEVLRQQARSLGVACIHLQSTAQL